MVVITLTNCPPALRGDLTLWLPEVDTGVFVGRVSARVRERLWERIVEHVKEGRVVMVYSARNEQGLEFRVHQGNWLPIDFDGLQLMMRPAPAKRTVNRQPENKGYSSASRFQKARRMGGGKPKYALPPSFVVVDVETTGLSPHADEMIEVAAIRTCEGKACDRFQTLIRIEKPLSKKISDLTGITQELLNTKGSPLEDALPAFLAFVGTDHVVSHQTSFDYGFLRAACKKLQLMPFNNPCTDTLPLARRLVKDVRDYRLSTLAVHLDIPITTIHRAMADCETTLLLFRKLIEIGNQLS